MSPSTGLAVFCSPSEPYIPEGPEYEKIKSLFEKDQMHFSFGEMVCLINRNNLHFGVRYT